MHFLTWKAQCITFRDKAQDLLKLRMTRELNLKVSAALLVVFDRPGSIIGF